MQSHLCNRCGTCVGLSDGAIVFEDKLGKYQAKIIRPISDEKADLLWEACAGKYFDFPAYRKNVFGETTPSHEYTGAYRSISIGHTLDGNVRRKSASGGILSQILIWLLEKKRIDGAVVLRMSKKEPWLTEAFIATTKAEILEAAQSKYIISSVNEILPQMESFKGTLAYVGLPGQIQSILKLQKLNHPSVKNISYIFGPFYGNTLHFSSIKSFLRSYGEKDPTQITKLYFRYGEWPGNMRVELKSGKVIELAKFHANYLIPFHILKNSLLCTDLSNEYTDISGGDAWAPVYEERGLGFSMVIGRSERGQQILEEMQKEHVLKLNAISVDEAIEMHSHGYDLKKRGTFIRMQFRKWMGLSNPDYGYTIKGFSLSRYFIEFVIDNLFILSVTQR